MEWAAVALYGGRTSGGDVAAATTAYLSTTGIFWHHESVTPTDSARPDRVPADTSDFASSPAVTQAAWSLVTGHWSHVFSHTLLKPPTSALMPGHA